MSSRIPFASCWTIRAGLLLVLATCSSPPPAPPPGGKTVLLSGEAAAPHSAAEPRRKRTVLITDLDEERVGKRGSEDVAAQIGVIDSPELNAYVRGIGEKLLRGIPGRSHRYRFFIVDQVEPNAFAMPGGYIFISRGLLALINTEDELANVIGHEITHVARRHSAAREQTVASSSPLLMAPLRVAKLSSYARDMERTADRGGQHLAAAAGYDPMGMSTFLESLGRNERLLFGHARRPTFFDTHPSSQERAAGNAIRASEMRWRRDPSLGDTRASLLKNVDGLDIGQRPETGIFQGGRFLQPDLDFQIRFPDGWDTQNGNQVVGARAPRGAAVIFLEASGPAESPRAAAERFVAENAERYKMKVTESKSVKIGGVSSWRIRIDAGGRLGRMEAYVLFIPYRDSVWRITGMAPAISAKKYQGRIFNTMRSFRPLTAEQRDSLESTKLRIVKARPGESISELSQRTGNIWDASQTSSGNAFFPGRRFEGGELVKIARSESYRSTTQ